MRDMPTAARFMVCPSCGGELWLIEGGLFRCFVCRRPFFEKNLLTRKNIYSLNKKLEHLAKHRG